MMISLLSCVLQNNKYLEEQTFPAQQYPCNIVCVQHTVDYIDISPDLELDCAAIYTNSFNIEIHPNSCEALAVELVIHVPLHQGGLPTGLANT